MPTTAPTQAQARLALHFSFPMLANLCRIRDQSAEARFGEIEGLPYG